MTWEEGELLAAKLTRVWALGQNVDWFVGSGEGDSASFAFRTMLTESVCFSCRDSEFGAGLLFRLSAQPHGPTACWVNHLSCSSETGEIRRICLKAVLPSFEKFVAEWTDAFRRNCWLSGCPIECSTHEQLEWTLWLREQEKKI